MYSKLLKPLIIVLVTLLLLEAVLHILGWGDPVLYVKDKRCGFRLAPNQKKYMFGPQIQVNSFGLRGPEPEKGKKNILFFGDSVTNGGARIPDNKTFVSLINEKLSHTEFQALNASVNNFGPKNIEGWFLLLKNRIEFDRIVLVIPTADFRRGFTRAPSRVGLHDDFICRSHYFFRVFRIILGEYIERLKPHRPNPSTRRLGQNDNYPSIIYENIEAYRRIIEKISHAIIYFVPSREEILNRTPHIYKKKFIEQLSQGKTKVRIVDLFPALVQYDSSIFRDGCHYNRKGHEVLGQIMWPTVEKTFLREREFLL